MVVVVAPIAVASAGLGMLAGVAMANRSSNSSSSSGRTSSPAALLRWGAPEPAPRLRPPRVVASPEVGLHSHPRHEENLVVVDVGVNQCQRLFQTQKCSPAQFSMQHQECDIRVGKLTKGAGPPTTLPWSHHDKKKSGEAEEEKRKRRMRNFGSDAGQRRGLRRSAAGRVAACREEEQKPW
uniref:Uncharacterized protein n=1 Tax=Oryza nivara TaxID=4536 RepID=A0A0E0GZU8_ORYNI